MQLLVFLLFLISITLITTKLNFEDVNLLIIKLFS